MNYEVIKDKHNHGDYRVEAINHEGEGEGYVTIFVGFEARKRAEEYADWKNGVAVPLRKAS